MANSIIIPGEENTEQSVEMTEDTQYLKIDRYLNEFESDDAKRQARLNLEVYSTDYVDTELMKDQEQLDQLKQILGTHLDAEDPHSILDKMQVNTLVRTDGSTSFTEPQSGVDPIDSNDLTTKKYVDNSISAKLEEYKNQHKNEDNPHKISEKIQDALSNYVKESQVYLKEQVFTKNEANTLYIKKDGSTPFTKPQRGADPQIDSDLATKRYIDSVIYGHRIELDAHGFRKLLNDRLAQYAKLSNVWDKTQSYSRSQIDSLVRSLVNEAAEEALQNHINLYDPHDTLTKIKQEKYIKQDGSIPFKSPQRGVDAVEKDELVTLNQLQIQIESVHDTIENLPEPIWKTSGPAEATVGQVEIETPLHETMTFQEIMDAIFYGKAINIEVPDFVVITETCPVTLCIHGSIGLVEYAELYQNGQLVCTLQREQFENGCVTVDSLPLLEDAEFVFKVFYTNGSVHEESKTVNCYLPVFVGLLPKWRRGFTITMDYLIELCKEDTEGTQNRFLNQGKDLTSFSFYYQFKDSKLRHPFIVIPKDYPDLDNMVTQCQNFGIEAFDVIDEIPLQIPGVEEGKIFKVYIYNQALSNLNQEVTFNFTPKE